jgi:hypothetical protein
MSPARALSARATRTFTARSKYGAVPTVSHGIRFHSAAEARRYDELLLLARAERITHLVIQPRFDLWAACPMENGRRDIVCVGTYVADFQYRDQDAGGRTVVEDVKGMKTPLYKLKKKIAEACYAMEIREVRRR